jgi:cytochrome c553
MKTLLPAMIALLVMGLAQGARAQDAKPAGDAAAGAKKNAMCIGCHGIVGYQASFPEIYKVPMIAGQNAAYIASALAAYKKGDRKHPSMRAIAQSLSEQDMADLAAYYQGEGGQPVELPKAPATPPNEMVAALLKKGACATCHGDNFSAPIDATYPKLSGQHADYLFVALKAYKTEKNAYVGRSNAIMAAQAKPYTNAELKALSKYLASLPGALKTVPQDKFR